MTASTAEINDRRIPCFINAGAGRAEAMENAARNDQRLEVRECKPAQLTDVIKTEVAAGSKRIAVIGGDGTVAAAAAGLVETAVELAILPGGTLNHCARTFGIPVEPEQAVETAISGSIQSIDAAFVNDRLFLNTSSVGAYVRYVGMRDRYDRRLGYYLASALATVQTLARLKSHVMHVKVGGHRYEYGTPLVFIGVGERELRVPMLGDRMEDGQPALHVIVTRGRGRRRLVRIALGAALRGVTDASHDAGLDSFIDSECTIEVRRRSQVAVALDGEITTLDTPLRYRIVRDALKIVVPSDV